MKTAKNWLGIIGLLLLTVLGGSFIHTNTALAASKGTALNFWAGPFGGTPYVALFAMMDTMNKTHPWLKGAIIESEGSWDNALHSGKDAAKRPYVVTVNDLGTFTMSQTGKAKQMKGQKPIPKGERKIIGAHMHSANIVVTTNPGIKTGQDLKGRKMAGWTTGSGAWTTLEMMFKMWKIKFSDLRSYDGLQPKASADALRDGLVDAIHLSEPFDPENPNLMTGSFSELIASGKPLYHIPMSKEDYDPIAAQYLAGGDYPHLWKKLPAGHWVKSWPSAGINVVVGVIFVWKEMPEEIQYELAKNLIEQNKMVIGHGGQAGLLTPAVLIGGIPDGFDENMAPGALRYYKEKGLWQKYRK